MNSPDFKRIGPGIIVAATGLGAGDIVAASQAGAQYGTVLLWAVIVGGVLKFTLNEGLARWQLSTGTTMLEGWIDRLPVFVSVYFAVYLLLWTFIVGAALMAACGLAAFAIFPQLSIAQWGIVHSIFAFIFVLFGGYKTLEPSMKVFVGLMFVAILICAVKVSPSLPEISTGLFVPRMPEKSLAYVLGIIGGVGGSVTVLSYGYWMREAGWQKKNMIKTMRLDLAVAYGLTVLFGISIIVVSAGVQPELAAGNNMALAVADHLGEVMGLWGKWVFLLGFWGAVFSSMVGVWHGVPYLFANFFYHRKGEPSQLADDQSIASSGAYKGYLVYLAFLPMILLTLDRPVWLVVLYAVAGAFFMPLLAFLLLYMNGKLEWVGEQRNSLPGKAVLVFCLLLFGGLLINEFVGQFS